ncbi:sensor histidine kinase [Cohnella cholangitidis]|uniref:Sensor histidine kinase n=1 Tax=Cohnella cholangitidis TaxID=2598458 RepID=A0A7G5BWE2_9BACL|nr:sensor histidine kinase [Cohnella cholangitidis]QMV41276.1 sensor histidine kinase [Cohnella cholangitidis]
MSRTVSIRSILLTAILFLMIFPLVVITFITYQKQNDLFQNQASQFVQQSVAQTKSTLDTNLNEIDRLTWSLLYQQSLEFIAAPLDTTYQLNEANRKFKEKVYSDLFSGKLNHIRTISFVTPDSYVLSTDSSLAHYDQLDRKNYNYIVNQFNEEPLKMHWLNNSQAIYQSKAGFNTPVHASVTAARRIVDSNTAELRGYLFIQLNDLFLDEYLRGVRIGSTGSLQITDHFGEVIYSQQSDLFNNPKITSAIQELPSFGSGTITVDGKWLLSYDTSAVSNWKLTAVVPLNEVLGPNQQILKVLLIMSGLGAIVSFVVALLFTAVLSKPVIGLAKVMSVASIDNLNVREQMSSIREISILQRNFNRLVDRTQQLLIENENAQKQKGDAQLKTLQMQIQPHFLYNTLDTIYWMSKKHGAEPISKLVTALGKFFRFTLNSSLERVSLEREVEHVENYLRILAFRYRDKLDYRITMEPELNDVWTMPLILQPIVENAIEHGIARLKTGGHINLDIYRSGHEVLIDIVNDGDDTDLSRMKQLLEDEKQSDHVGLRNVHQRIQLSFGEAFGIRLIDRVNGRTLVRLCIPLSRESD